MRKLYAFLSVALFLSAIISCQEQEEMKNEISDDIKAQLVAAGFDVSEGLKRTPDGIIVEYDILLTEDEIRKLAPAESAGQHLEEEHYRTTNIVTGTPRTIRVYMDPGFDSYMQSAFDGALARYNAEGLTLTFQRTTSKSNAHIQILTMYEPPSGGFVTLGVSAGFPSSSGNPASPIKLNTYVYNSSSQRADAKTVIAHEIGHAIGFRHTDYMRRRFSCGSGGGEQVAPYGAVHISGTPRDPESGSYMLACSNGSDRPFTRGDKTALSTVY